MRVVISWFGRIGNLRGSSVPNSQAKDRDFYRIKGSVLVSWGLETQAKISPISSMYGIYLHTFAILYHLIFQGQTVKLRWCRVFFPASTMTGAKLFAEVELMRKKDQGKKGSWTEWSGIQVHSNYPTRSPKKGLKVNVFKVWSHQDSTWSIYSRSFQSFWHIFLCVFSPGRWLDFHVFFGGETRIRPKGIRWIWRTQQEDCWRVCP